MNWPKLDSTQIVASVGATYSEGAGLYRSERIDTMPPSDAHLVQSMGASDPQAWLASAAEELTFQFSEIVEAREHALETRLESQSGEHVAQTLKVEQVQAIARLMEGREGYDFLRAQARAFAQAHQENPEQAIAMLHLESMTPDRRYALIRMAQQTLESQEASEASRQSLQRLQDAPAPGVSPLWRTHTLVKAVSEGTDQVQPYLDPYYTLIGTQPSARTVFDTAVELADSQGLLMALSRMQRAWGRHLPVSEMEQLGGLWIVQRLVQVVRTMHHETQALLDHFGVLGGHQHTQFNRHVRSLLDLTQSSLPANLIDKLITTWTASPRICSRCLPRSLLRCASCHRSRMRCMCAPVTRSCTCKDTRAFLLSLLHLHARNWPEAVWASADTKKSLLEQLIKKQPSRSSLEMARGRR